MNGLPEGHKPGRLILGVLVGLAIGTAAGWGIGQSKGREQLRVEAVRNGHAHHRIVDEFGRTEFEWMPVPGTSQK